MGIAETLGAIFGGGATGLLGSIINSVGDYLKMREKNKHDQRMAEIETEHLKMEIDRDVIVAKEAATAKMEEAGAKVQEASYEADKRTYLPTKAVESHIVIVMLMAVVDFLRGIVRPGLTIYLCIITTVLYFHVAKILKAAGGVLTTEQAYSLTQTIILGILYITFTAVGWWFGSRSKFDKILKLE